MKELLKEDLKFINGGRICRRIDQDGNVNFYAVKRDDPEGRKVYMSREACLYLFDAHERKYTNALMIWNVLTGNYGILPEEASFIVECYMEYFPDAGVDRS